jgi:hypothetical protein
MEKQGKSLHEKQLIRSIADFIIENPQRFREIFGSKDKVESIFPELESVVDFVMMYDDRNYHERLRSEISGVTDRQTKAIFEAALKSYFYKKAFDLFA